jgi:hypothetical protein
VILPESTYCFGWSKSAPYVIVQIPVYKLYLSIYIYTIRHIFSNIYTHETRMNRWWAPRPGDPARWNSSKISTVVSTLSTHHLSFSSDISTSFSKFICTCPWSLKLCRLNSDRSSTYHVSSPISHKIPPPVRRCHANKTHNAVYVRRCHGIVSLLWW